MRSPNHIAGGIVFTGVFGALMNVNILASPWHIVTCVVASLLPDIDLPHAPAGRLFTPSVFGSINGMDTAPSPTPLWLWQR